MRICGSRGEKVCPAKVDANGNISDDQREQSRCHQNHRSDTLGNMTVKEVKKPDPN